MKAELSSRLVRKVSRLLQWHVDNRCAIGGMAQKKITFGLWLARLLDPIAYRAQKKEEVWWRYEDLQTGPVAGALRPHRAHGKTMAGGR